MWVLCWNTLWPKVVQQNNWFHVFVAAEDRRWDSFGFLHVVPAALLPPSESLRYWSRRHTCLLYSFASCLNGFPETTAQFLKTLQTRNHKNTFHMFWLQSFLSVFSLHRLFSSLFLFSLHVLLCYEFWLITRSEQCTSAFLCWINNFQAQLKTYSWYTV